MRLLLLTCLFLMSCSKQEVNSVSREIPEPNSPGANLLLEFCNECHVYPDPASKQAIYWTQTLPRMRKHREQRGLPTMNKNQERELLAYLQRNGASK